MSIGTIQPLLNIYWNVRLIGLGHSNRLGLSNLRIANVPLRGGGGEGIDCTFAVGFGLEINIDVRGVNVKGVEFVHINVPARKSGFTAECLVSRFCQPVLFTNPYLPTHTSICICPFLFLALIAFFYHTPKKSRRGYVVCMALRPLLSFSIGEVPSTVLFFSSPRYGIGGSPR
jgi:hypothetical protein